MCGIGTVQFGKNGIKWRSGEKSGERTICTVWKVAAGMVYGRRGICLLLDYGIVQADADADLAG